MRRQHFIAMARQGGRDQATRCVRRRGGAFAKVLVLLAAMAGLGGCTHTMPSGSASAMTPKASEQPRWQQFADGIYLLSGEFQPGQQPDGNSIVIVEGREALVFDTGRHAAHATAIVRFLREQDLQLRWIINSHWHLDHSGGNRLLHDAFPDAQLISGRGVLAAEQDFLARYRQSLLQRQQQADITESAREANRLELARIDDSAARYPQRFVDATQNLSLAGRELQLHVTTHAVSETDIWLLDRRSGVVLAGDLLTLPVPFLDTACPQIWWRALQDMSAVSFTLAIPGHGPAMSSKGVAAYAQAFAQLQRCAASPASNRQCADEWLNALTPPFDAMSENYVRQLLDYYLDQHLRPGSNQVSHCPRAS